jgi:DNA-binding NarL/FixJ family response regulator
LRQLLDVPPDVIRNVYGIDVEIRFEVVGEAASGEETVRIVHAAQPDLLLLDLCMPRMSGLDVLRELIGAAAPRTIVLTGSITDQSMLSAVRLGVHGLVEKNATTELLFEAMIAVMAGRYWLDRRVISDLVEFTRPLLESRRVDSHGDARLTARERDVLTLVAAGYANKEIARQYMLSEETVKHHVTRLLAKVGASNRRQLTALVADGALDPSASPAVE